MDDLLRNLRYSARRLRRRPLFTAVAVATIALGIGAATAIFSVVHGVLLHPLPVEREDDLVKIWKYDPGRDFDHFPVTFPEFRRWRDANGSFEALAAMVSEGTWELVLEPPTADAEPSLVDVAPVSSEFFDVVGVTPLHGRAFEPNDEAADGVYATALSHSAWVRRFSADPGVLGRTLVVHGRPHKVVGILPEGFDFPAGTDLWRCLLEESPAELEGLGRLREGVGPGQARAEIATIARRFAQEEASWLLDKKIVVRPLRDSLVGAVRRPLQVLLAAVSFLLAIAAVNVAGLQLIETAARRRQFAVRSALGEPRRRLVGRLLTESALLAAAGGIGGVGLATLALEALRVLRPANLPRLDEVALYPPVLGFAAAVTVAAALIFGLVPALRSPRGAAASALRVGSATRDRRHSSLLGALVVAEIALALVLLIGAGLFLRSFVEHLRLDRGFAAENLLSVSIKSADPRLRTLYAELLPRLEALPGVAAASPMINRPFATTDGYDAVPRPEGRPADETADLPWTSLETVTPSWIDAVGLDIERGRFFDRGDQADSLPAAVVNRALAERYWPGEEAIGRRLMIFPDDGWRTVVGVVSDLRLRHATEVRLSLYLPLAQSPWLPRHLVVRTLRDAAGTAAAVRGEIRRLLPSSVVEIAPMSSLVGKELAAPRFQSLLTLVFAGLALCLAAVGIYGVMASLVGERRHEIGVRMALGADGREILRLVTGHGLRLAMAGIAVGVVASLGLTRLVEGLLFRTRPLDPVIFSVLSLVLLAVAGLAVLLPARGAARVDPLSVIRAE